MIAVTYPDASFEAFSYDRSGNRILTTTRAGQAIAYDYDLHNRLVKKTYPDSTETAFAYDQLGRMTGAANPTADYAFSYNDINQLLEYNLILEGEEYAVSYGWDLSGNKTAITYPGGTEYNRHYDNLNRLERVENSVEDVLAEYAYDDL